MGSSATALKTNIENMKLFVVLSLTSVALGGMDYEMTQKWQKLKAMESCWGEENMKLVMVDMKKAIAKCSHEDAPELSLPPYRSAYRFTNTMINKGDDYSSSSYSSDDAFDMFSDMFDTTHKMDNYRSSSDYKNPMGRMSQFKNMFNSMRFKRAAGDNLDLGDRLVE